MNRRNTLYHQPTKYTQQTNTSWVTTFILRHPSICIQANYAAAYTVHPALDLDWGGPLGTLASAPPIAQVSIPPLCIEQAVPPQNKTILLILFNNHFLRNGEKMIVI